MATGCGRQQSGLVCYPAFVPDKEPMARPRRKTYYCLTCSWTAWAGYKTRLVCGGCGAAMLGRREAVAAAAEATRTLETDPNDPLRDAIATLVSAPDRAAVRDMLWEAGLVE